MNELLKLAVFARIDEYAGAWLMSPSHFASIVQSGKLIDMRQHIVDGREPMAVVEKVAAAGGKTIALVRLQGVLMKGRSWMGGTSTIEARREIRNAASDSGVDGIMLAIDSPGGTVAGTSDLASEISAAAKIKPVYAHIDDLGASAAYWAASQAERITANSPTALIGSIGTVQVVYDQSQAFANEGIKTFLFATGPLKGMGAPGMPITEQQSAHMQGVIDSVQTAFDAGVKKGRNLSAAELNAVRHGGVFTASEAMDAKLIDAIQPLSKSINDMARSLSSNSKQRANVKTFQMIQHGGLPSLLVSQAS